MEKPALSRAERVSMFFTSTWIVPKKAMSEEHRTKLADVLFRSRATEGNRPNSGEQAQPHAGAPINQKRGVGHDRA